MTGPERPHGIAAFKQWVNGELALWDEAALQFEPDPPAKAPKPANDGNVRSYERVLYRVTAVLSATLLSLVLLATVAALPLYGRPDTPAQNEVAQRYIEQGLEETGAVNLVSGMILDYRAFDTFGESCVLFLAATAVFMLLRKDSHNSPSSLLREREEDLVIIKEADNRIMKSGAHILFPFIMLFGIYVVLNGHLSPGGGFSGGLILGSALIMYSVGCGQDKVARFFSFKTYSLISFTCLAVYAGAKTYSFFTGANHLHSIIPKGTPGAILSSGLILPLNICVGCVVGCTMYAFYALFNKGDL